MRPKSMTMTVTNSTCSQTIQNMDQRARVGSSFNEPFPEGEMKGTCAMQNGAHQATTKNGIMVFCQMRQEQFNVKVYNAGYLDFGKANGKVRANITGVPSIVGQDCQTEMDVKLNFQ
jgi:hypothetical protein